MMTLFDVKMILIGSLLMMFAKVCGKYHVRAEPVFQNDVFPSIFSEHIFPPKKIELGYYIANTSLKSLTITSPNQTYFFGKMRSENVFGKTLPFYQFWEKSFVKNS